MSAPAELAGATPVRQVVYRGGVQFGYELAEYYEAIGYAPRSRRRPIIWRCRSAASAAAEFVKNTLPP